MTRRQLILASLGPKQETLFHFGHENVLGTSLDLTFLARNEADAEQAEAAALAEIDRLRAVLSTARSRSISASAAASACSASASLRARKVRSSEVPRTFS